MPRSRKKTKSLIMHSLALRQCVKRSITSGRRRQWAELHILRFLRLRIRFIPIERFFLPLNPALGRIEYVRNYLNARFKLFLIKDNFHGSLSSSSNFNTLRNLDDNQRNQTVLNKLFGPFKEQNEASQVCAQYPTKLSNSEPKSNEFQISSASVVVDANAIDNGRFSRRLLFYAQRLNRHDHIRDYSNPYELQRILSRQNDYAGKSNIVAIARHRNYNDDPHAQNQNRNVMSIQKNRQQVIDDQLGSRTNRRHFSNITTQVKNNLINDRRYSANYTRMEFDERHDYKHKELNRVPSPLAYSKQTRENIGLNASHNRLTHATASAQMVHRKQFASENQRTPISSDKPALTGELNNDVHSATRSVSDIKSDDVDHITDKVMQQIDYRIKSWKERTGHV